MTVIQKILGVGRVGNPFTNTEALSSTFPVNYLLATFSSLEACISNWIQSPRKETQTRVKYYFFLNDKTSK